MSETPPSIDLRALQRRRGDAPVAVGLLLIAVVAVYFRSSIGGWLQLLADWTLPSSKTVLMFNTMVLVPAMLLLPAFKGTFPRFYESCQTQLAARSYWVSKSLVLFPPVSAICLVAGFILVCANYPRSGVAVSLLPWLWTVAGFAWLWLKPAPRPSPALLSHHSSDDRSSTTTPAEEPTGDLP